MTSFQIYRDIPGSAKQEKRSAQALPDVVNSGAQTEYSWNEAGSNFRKDSKCEFSEQEQEEAARCLQAARDENEKAATERLEAIEENGRLKEELVEKTELKEDLENKVGKLKKVLEDVRKVTDNVVKDLVSTSTINL